MKKCIAAVDLGGTNTVTGLADESGNISFSKSFLTENYNSIKEWVDEIDKWIKALPKDIKPEGIGIGAPNGNFYNGSIEFAPNLKWEGEIPLKKLIEEKTGLPTIVTNDANAAALGEMLFGGAKGLKDFMLVTLGTGLGCGIVANGSLINGFNGFAGELGHINAVPDGRQCSCGLKGCLETYVSARGIKQTMTEIQKTNKQKLESVTELSVYDIYRMAKNGNEEAIQTFYFTGIILGHNLARAATILAPEKIFLFGGIANADKFILE